MQYHAGGLTVTSSTRSDPETILVLYTVAGKLHNQQQQSFQLVVDAGAKEKASRQQEGWWLPST